MAKSRICSVECCSNTAHCRGWCHSHYGNWYRNGDPTKFIKPKTIKPDCCTVDGCSKPVRSIGLCQAHYQRNYKHGDPTFGRVPDGDPWRYMLGHMHDDCPKWPFATNSGGRGQIAVSGTRKKVLVHKIVCEMVNGPKPSENHVAAHECGKGHEGCFGASCLSWKTPTENSLDRYKHGTMRLGQDHPHAKLTEEAILIIRSADKSVSNASLARRFGVSPSTLSLARSGKKWTWV